MKRGESSGISADCKLNDGDWMRPRLLWPLSTGPETGCNRPVTTRVNAARFLHHPPDGDEGRVCILMLEDEQWSVNESGVFCWATIKNEYRMANCPLAGGAESSGDLTRVTEPENAGLRNGLWRQGVPPVKLLTSSSSSRNKAVARVKRKTREMPNGLHRQVNAGK